MPKGIPATTGPRKRWSDIERQDIVRAAADGMTMIDLADYYSTTVNSIEGIIWRHKQKTTMPVIDADTYVKDAHDRPSDSTYHHQGSPITYLTDPPPKPVNNSQKCIPADATLDCIQYTGFNGDEVMQWLHARSGEFIREFRVYDSGGTNRILWGRNNPPVYAGQWLVYKHHDHVIAMPADEFEKEYRLV